MALELPERDQSIEEIADAARMQLELRGQRLGVHRPVGQQCEQSELYRAQQRFRAPKCKTKLHDGVRR